MGDLPTVAVEDGKSYRIINESDFDPKTMTRFTGALPRDTVTDLTTRNADGTFSEPTPTDIRYPDKDKTEFANNHGAFVGKSAAEMRAEQELPDAPGGLDPDPVLATVVEENKKSEAEAVKVEAKKVEADAKTAEAEAKADEKTAAKK